MVGAQGGIVKDAWCGYGRDRRRRVAIACMARGCWQWRQRGSLYSTWLEAFVLGLLPVGRRTGARVVHGAVEVASECH